MVDAWRLIILLYFFFMLEIFQNNKLKYIWREFIFHMAKLSSGSKHYFKIRKELPDILVKIHFRPTGSELEDKHKVICILTGFPGAGQHRSAASSWDYMAMKASPWDPMALSGPLTKAVLPATLRSFSTVVETGIAFLGFEGFIYSKKQGREKGKYAQRLEAWEAGTGVK